MRINLLSLVVGTIGLSLAGLLALSGHAGDYDGSRSDGSSMATYPRQRNNSASRQRPEYPPTEPYRELYFFPHAAPLRPTADKVRDVTVSDTMYSPSILYVTSGTTVRWTNQGTHHHTITSNWRWESGELKKGETFSLLFTRKGTYHYYCRLHSQFMRGKVVVYY
jgi:plastocyanin